jgi:alkyl hydroperoxide reductase subunit AhpC
VKIIGLSLDSVSVRFGWKADIEVRLGQSRL